MTRGLFACAAILWAALVATTSGSRIEAPLQPRIPDPVSKATIDTYCVTCHSARLKSGGLVLENADLARLADNVEVW